MYIYSGKEFIHIKYINLKEIIVKLQRKLKRIQVPDVDLEILHRQF